MYKVIWKDKLWRCWWGLFCLMTLNQVCLRWVNDAIISYLSPVKERVEFRQCMLFLFNILHLWEESIRTPQSSVMFAHVFRNSHGCNFSVKDTLIHHKFRVFLPSFISLGKMLIFSSAWSFCLFIFCIMSSAHKLAISLAFVTVVL